MSWQEKHACICDDELSFKCLTSQENRVNKYAILFGFRLATRCTSFVLCHCFQYPFPKFSLHHKNRYFVNILRKNRHVKTLKYISMLEVRKQSAIQCKLSFPEEDGNILVWNFKLNFVAFRGNLIFRRDSNSYLRISVSLHLIRKIL